MSFTVYTHELETMVPSFPIKVAEKLRQLSLLSNKEHDKAEEMSNGVTRQLLQVIKLCLDDFPKPSSGEFDLNADHCSFHSSRMARCSLHLQSQSST